MMKNKEMTIEEAVKELMGLSPVKNNNQQCLNQDTGNKEDSDRKEGKILPDS